MGNVEEAGLCSGGQCSDRFGIMVVPQLSLQTLHCSFSGSAGSQSFGSAWQSPVFAASPFWGASPGTAIRVALVSLSAAEHCPMGQGHSVLPSALPSQGPAGT